MTTRTFARLLVVVSLFGAAMRLPAAPTIWIDADTGNETDDVYAVFRLLSEPDVTVVGVSSAHFNNPDLVSFEKWNQYPTSGIKTVQISQDLNESLLRATDRSSIPHPLGADRQMGRAWGGKAPRDSAAAQGIIAAAKATPRGEKLIVICLGASTNVASAIALDGAIAERIRVYLLGAQYVASTGTWNKSEFNIRNDLNAFDFLLDRTDVDLVVMPINIIRPYRVEKERLYKLLNEQIPAEKILKQRWEETNPDDVSRVLWDVALVQAVLHPEFAQLSTVRTPPENTARDIRVYTGLNVPALQQDLETHFHGDKSKVPLSPK